MPHVMEFFGWVFGHFDIWVVFASFLELTIGCQRQIKRFRVLCDPAVVPALREVVPRSAYSPN